MAIIACPYCDKRVSDKAATCNHCGNNLSEISVEKLERMQRDNRLAQGQRLTIKDHFSEELEQDYHAIYRTDSELRAFVAQNPDVPVFVAGARDADYATVFDTMVLLQQAGVPRVGLMGQPPERDAR